MRRKSGFSLIEVLVVMFVFSILAVVITQSLAATLRNSKKSESSERGRENVQYAISIMERLLRNAQSLDCASSDGSKLVYKNERSADTYFACVTAGTDTFIASNSSSIRLTSNTVQITNCNSMFVCNTGVNVPDSVDITISAADTNAPGIEGGQISVSTKILLRNY